MTLDVDGEQSFAERALERRCRPDVVERDAKRRPDGSVDEPVHVFDVHPNHRLDKWPDPGRLKEVE